ncbi:MAG: peptidoglycan DD-metalloendopeptidase family protein [Desulfuromonadaceae bacterium]|nr:peptidoglycan DD-metalloendopeptidase family protein [Desulfuromonadaceae bacterium]
MMGAGILSQATSHAAVRLALAVLLVTGFLAAPVRGDDLDDKRRKLEQLQQQIRSTSGKLSQAREEERSVLDELETLEQQMDRSNAALKNASSELSELRKQIDQSRSDIDRYQRILGRCQADVEKRLRVLYTSGDITTLRLIFSTKSPLLMAENADFLSRITSHDKALLLNYREQLNQIRTSRLELEQHLAQQQQILQDRQQHKQQLAESSQRKKTLIRKIRTDKVALNQALQQLEERSQGMENLVKQLEEQSRQLYTPSGVHFSAMRGKLPWPTSGAVRSEFGTHRHQQFGAKVKSNGLEIAAVPGTPILAVWPGKVAFAAPFKGYGNLLILDHGNQYYSLYAQARQLKCQTGDLVDKGAVVAIAGFEQRDSYYFEIRQAGTPVNPRQWLQPRNR